MKIKVDQTDADNVSNIAGWAVFVGLMVLVVLALPAYLQTMDIQFLDLEFLSSLCGFAGWGPSGN